MSLSPSFPHGAPTLAEVLLQRTFAKPPQPFVDGEFLETLAHADDDQPPVTVALGPPAAAGDSSGPGTQPDAGGASTPSSAAPDPGRSVDVRV